MKRWIVALSGLLAYAASAASDSPYPDAFSRRDYQLGMSIAAFKGLPYPDLDQAPGAYPVCSNEPRSHDDTYLSAQLLDDALERAHVVKCVFFYPAPMTGADPMILEAGVGLAGERQNTEFYFIPSDDGAMRLFWIVTRGPEAAFSSLAPILIKAYGEPMRSTERLQTTAGGTIDNEILRWSRPESSVSFQHFAVYTRGFLLEHRLTPLFKKLEAARQADDAVKAKKL